MSYFSFELLDRGKPIVVFGRDGQVGKALQVYLSKLKAPAVFLGRADCDLSNEVAIRDALNKVASTMSVEDVYGSGKTKMIDTLQIIVKKQLDSTGIVIKKNEITGICLIA
jgi:D-arabinose 5-phosphate isomerase GutQ